MSGSCWAEGCALLSLKALVVCHLYHLGGAIFSPVETFVTLGTDCLKALGSVMEKEFCGHSFLQCPISAHLKQIPSVFNAVTKA